jgi:hypothetical protein
MKHLLAALALALPFSSQAQDFDTGTVDVYFQQVLVAGQLEGCSLVFTALERDNAYLKNEQVILNGSFVVRTMKGGLYFTGKLGTRPLADPQKWAAPEHFYFATTNGTTAGKARIFPADTPGYRLLMASALEEPVSTFLMELMDEQAFLVGFNRKPGGQDVYTRVKLNVSLKRDASGNARQAQNDETPREFAGCMQRLLSSFKSKVGSGAPLGR